MENLEEFLLDRMKFPEGKIMALFQFRSLVEDPFPHHRVEFGIKQRIVHRFDPASLFRRQRQAEPFENHRLQPLFDFPISRKMGFDQRALGAPRCECGGYMKPDIVLFGEVIPHQALHHADALARRCGAFMVVGTSALVYPAAHLPRLAKENGAVVIECNTAPTGLTDTVTDVFLEGPAGTVLPELVRLVRGD